jgi:hypothetical protein
LRILLETAVLARRNKTNKPDSCPPLLASHLFEVDRRERTGFSLPETGRPESARETTSACRGPKSGLKELREMAAKSAFLPAGSNNQVSEVCLVVCAVISEPVSPAFSLRSGNFLQNSANNRLLAG